jgi:hypothetical protein
VSLYQDTLGIHQGYTRDTSGYTWDTHRIRTVSLYQDTLGIHQRYTRNTSGYTWDTYGIHITNCVFISRYSRDTQEIHKRYALYTRNTQGIRTVSLYQDTPGIHQGYIRIHMGYI